MWETSDFHPWGEVLVYALTSTHKVPISKPSQARPLFCFAAAKLLSLVALTYIFAIMSASTAVAQDKKGSEDLATQATNPAAALIQLQLQDQIIPSSQNSSGFANTGIIQPVYPFVLGKDHYFLALAGKVDWAGLADTPNLSMSRPMRN